MSDPEMSQIVIIWDLDEVSVELELVGGLVGQSDRERWLLSGTISVETP
jgi:hypothetical protein